MTALPDEAFAAALASVPGMGPARLRQLLETHSPLQAWRTLGKADAPVAAIWQTVNELGITVAILGRDGYPPVLAADHEAPAVVFWLGSVGSLDRPRVAVVGTRRSTHYGREVARQLGAELAQAGVCVVSGLALGIDGAAHEGALAGHAAGGASPVGVVGSGLDVVYPRRHAGLWSRVAANGCLLSEGPPGTAPEAWRFPARNRILAGLAQLVVVVESHAAGGSMLTVEAAIKRGVTVMAVPGSVRSPSSAGTNRLLAEGCPPVIDTSDVLCALSLEGVQPAPASPPRPEPADEGDAAVLDAVDWEPTGVDTVLRRSGLALPAAVGALGRLEDLGLVRKEGGWWQRTG